MKESKICPKCQGSAIYTDAGLSKRGDRCSIPISSWTKLFVDVYLCTSCGYVEEYIMNKELNDEKYMQKLTKNWKKHS